ncbi:MAG: preprotein translocase subunit YajC [Firmicutes bacterium]|nr:preprotein translocase subunit YajC [Bacillota bacterium]
MSWVIIIVMFAAIYFLTIRPQNKRDKEARKMRDNLRPGDEIVTIGGIYGKVVRVTDDRVIIMVGSEKTKLEMAKSAISSVVSATSASTASSAPKTKQEEPEKEVSKPTPKTIRKLGAAKEAAENAENKAEEAVQAAEEAAEAVAEAVEKTEA